jgi:hypothetical protein
MKFFELIDELSAGKKIQRRHWVNQYLDCNLMDANYLNVHFNTPYGYTPRNWIPTLDDFEHDDWEVVRIK